MTPDFYYDEMLRWSFGFENPNKAAVIFACLIPIFWAGWLGAFRLRSARWKVTALVGAAVGFFATWGCLLLTFSRGGLVGAVAGMGLVSMWAWFSGKIVSTGRWSLHFRRISFWLSAILIGLVVAAALVLGMGSRSVEAIGDDASVGNRIELWGAALQMAYENPAGFGAGRSGVEFMQWYQDVGRTEGYRTMVNSYLTFLVEHGWLAFALVVIAVAAFWTWTWPRSGSAQSSWSVALWASLAAFIVSGIFSTTMEEPLLWIVPALATTGLIGLRFASGSPLQVRTPRWVLAIGATCLLLSACFIAGMIKSLADPVQRTFARNTEKHPTVVALSPKAGAPVRQLVVYPDESVLGPDWGKLLRRLAMETHREVRIGSSGLTKDDTGDVMLVGYASSRKSESSRNSRTYLLAPMISDHVIEENSVLLLPEIDEDGRGAYWREKAESTQPNEQAVVLLIGVGTRVDWAWDQVIRAVNSR
jgi:hypothetical protein